MWMPDVNVLIYAHRRDDPDHAFYRDWLQGVVNRGETVAISPLVASGFVRVVTNPRIFSVPDPLGPALAMLDDLASRRNVVLVHTGPRHLALFGTLCRATGARAKLVADAQLAAVAMEAGATLVTRDHDFSAFEPHGLRCLHLAP